MANRQEGDRYLRIPEADTLLPGEWHPQDATLMALPHSGTDWAPVVYDAVKTYLHMTVQIGLRQRVLLLCRDPEKVRPEIPAEVSANVQLIACPFDDTWIRDYGPITVFRDGRPVLLDFGFDGWGGKFRAGNDNAATSWLFRNGHFGARAGYLDCRHMIIEGGSIESDGRGTILTTERCLLANSRNPDLGREQIEEQLLSLLGLRQIIWLRSGYLEGDDTDGHVDTLVRFCNPDTIAYVSCSDVDDSHYAGLRSLERELEAARDVDGKPYNLVPLPMAEPIYGDNGIRLAATYANFVIINGAVLMPVYGSPLDRVALERMELIFPSREIIPIDCRTLILQGGALHCATMQIPEGVL